MNNQPKISVITPLYNAVRFISETIKSIQNQTYENYEHIIIDDCSTDGSYDVVCGIASQDPHIIILRNEKNSRVAHTRNRGIDAATGDYLLFLDSDDLLCDDALEILINTMLSTPSAKICTAPYRKMSEDGSVFYGVIDPPKRVFYRDMLKTCTMSHLTTLLSRNVINDYRYKNIGHEDYLFYLSIMANGYCCYGYTEKPLGIYRLTAGSLSRNKLKTFRYQWNIYHNELNFNLLKSCYYFAFYAVNGVIKLLK